MKDGLFKKFLAFSYGNWLGLIIGFGTTMVTTRLLATEDFGRASMFTLAVNIIMIFIMFGSDQAFIRYFYEVKKEQRGRLLYRTMKTPVISVMITAAILLIFRESISELLFDEKNPMAVVMLVIGITAQLGDRFSRLVIRMQQKGALYSFLEVLLKIISFVSLIGFYYLLGPSYEIIIYSTVISLLAIFAIAVFKEKKFWFVRTGEALADTYSRRRILRFGMPFMVTSLITWLFESFDKIAIRSWSTLDELGLYSAAFKIVALVHVFQITFNNFWTPVCYEHFQKKPEDTEFYARMMRVISLGMFTVGIGSIAGKDIIIAFLGSDYRAAANIMPYLIFMPMLHTISETTVMGINFMKKPKWHIFIAGTSCVSNIIGNAILVPEYGAIGAAVSTAIAYVIFFTLRTVISNRFYPVKQNLLQFYFMLALIFAYATFSIYTGSILLNMGAGFALFLFMLLLYKRDTKDGIAYIRSMNLRKILKRRK